MAKGDKIDVSDYQLYEVLTPSGGSLRLQTKEEADFYNDHKKKYLREYKITNGSDLLEVERVLMMETMCVRWSSWLAQGFDYDEGIISNEECRKNIKEYSAEIRATKQNLGIDRLTRTKDKGEDTALYVDKLLTRAKQFGYMRNKQAAKAIQLFKEAETLIGTYMRCDADEREKLRLDKDSIFKWFTDVAIPEFEEIDRAFRQDGPDAQKMWVKEL